MNDQDRISDELLNAFIDDELDTADWTDIVNRIREDENLAGRVCELRQYKDMVQKAYCLPRVSPTLSQRRANWHRRCLTAVAVSLTLVVGGMAGWLIHSVDFFHFGTQFAQIDPVTQDDSKILVHIATADPARLKTALDDAEQLLTTYQASAKKVQIKFVANADGVELLQNNSSPHVERILDLMARHDNLAFLACSRSLEKMRLKGLEVHLMPDIGIIPGALEEIVARLQEGWIYIKA